MIWPISETQQRNGMNEGWNILAVGQHNPLHIRAIWGKGVPDPQPVKNITFTAKKYPSLAGRKRAFEDKALLLNQQGFNIYTCFNLISPDFPGDEENGLSVKDADIVGRRYLLVDFDRAVTNQPATDDEIDEVFKVAHELEKDAFYSKGLEPLTVNSGNGAHIYLPINLLNDDVSKFRCQKMLQAMARKYDTDNVKVDTAVFNASRITKMPGTIARKGIEVPDDTGIHERYYRMASVVS
jgi:hypothetical protein